MLWIGLSFALSLRSALHTHSSWCHFGTEAWHERRKKSNWNSRVNPLHLLLSLFIFFFLLFISPCFHPHYTEKCCSEICTLHVRVKQVVRANTFGAWKCHTLTDEREQTNDISVAGVTGETICYLNNEHMDNEKYRRNRRKRFAWQRDTAKRERGTSHLRRCEVKERKKRFSAEVCGLSEWD